MTWGDGVTKEGTPFVSGPCSVLENLGKAMGAEESHRWLEPKLLFATDPTLPQGLPAVPVFHLPSL